MADVTEVCDDGPDHEVCKDVPQRVAKYVNDEVCEDVPSVRCEPINKDQCEEECTTEYETKCSFSV